MIEYIYFVKCPQCEDEHFSFFDEAKEFALRCLSKKPIITQTEVCRNDFGECTDSCDLGTVWSWEDMMDNMTDDEPAKVIFTKDDLCDYDSENDPEFIDHESEDDDFYFTNSLEEEVATKVAFNNNNDRVEFFKLCSEIGIETAADLKRFISDNGVTGNATNLLKKLRDYRAELGPDFKIRESAETTNKFVIVGEKEDYSKFYYNVPSENWVAKVNEATLFDDRNRAVEVWHDVDKSDFYTTRIMIKPVRLKECNSSGSNSYRKPIPEGMTIEQLIEEMEENEDTVECAGCEELFPKDECTHKDGIGWLCSDCEDTVVKCTWCEELYDKSECRYEVDLGWLCSRCEQAIKSRGETLTFKEGNYWDFLDESTMVSDSANIGKHVRLVNSSSRYNKEGMEYTLFDLKQLLRSSRITDLSVSSINLIAKFDNNCSIMQETDKAYLITIPCYFRNQLDRSKLEEHPVYVRCWVPKPSTKIIEEAIHEELSFADLVKDAINHLVNDLGKDPWADDFADDVIADIENNYDGEAPEDIEKYGAWCHAVASEVSRQVNKAKPASFLEELEEPDTYRERLELCLECGAEQSFDKETGICIECGFNI